MTEISKERRAHWIDGIGQWLYYGVPIGDTCDLPSAEELQEIVKALDERDRYRALLVEARAAIDVVGWALQSDIDKTRERIDAALEGNDGD